MFFSSVAIVLRMSSAKWLKNLPVRGAAFRPPEMVSPGSPS